MRGVATADWHLGFRAFSAMEGGRNAREVDVERALDRVVENTIEADPGLVTISGDVFDHPRVSMHAVLAFRDAIRRIREGTEAHVVILQGNHDAPRTADTKTPIHVPGDYDRVHVVTTPRRIRFTAASTSEVVSVACFPYVRAAESDGESYRLDPDPEADVNVLAMHAAVKGGADGDRLPHFYGGEGALDVGREADRWDVIAVGDYHEPTRLTEKGLVFYPGSLERTSSDIWSEHQEKGVVVYDTREGEAEFVSHETRRVSDWDLLDWDIDFLQPGPEHVNRALSSLHEEGYDGAIVRLKAVGFPREQRDQVDWSVVRELKRTCLHFQLDLEWADRDHALTSQDGERAREGLREQALEFFREDRPAVRSRALEHLGFEEDSDEEAEVVEVEEEAESEPAALAAGGAR